MRALTNILCIGASCAALSFLPGCAAQSAKPNMVEVVKATTAVEQPKVDRVIYDPSAWIGITETPALREGNYLARQTVFPYDLKEEFQSPRIRWIGYAADEAGTIYPIQFVWTGCAKEFGKLKMLALIEGTVSGKGLRGIHLSTLTTEAYRLDGSRIEQFDGKKFRADVAYQREIIRRDGTPVASLPEVRGVEEMLSTFWRIGGGNLLIPPSTDRETVWNIVKRNPTERLEQKYVDQASMAIVSSANGTVISTLFDGVRTLMTPCYGWHKECRVTDEQYFAATQQCIVRTSMERSQP